MSPIPKFSELPLRKGDPFWSAWGLYGSNDQLGTLNRLTDEVVREASKEIQTGTRVSMNWPLDAQSEVPFFGRQAFHKDVYQKGTRIVNDDTWSFNTQSSSQWDGLRHFGYQKEEKFYNGVTMDDIHGEHKSDVLGIHAWAEKGIVGRGVLLDFHSWRLENNVEYNPFERGNITLDQLKKVAEAQGVEIKFGDILIIRSGYMASYNKLSTDEVKQLAARPSPPTFSGVQQSEEVLEWIWNHFSAVAGDQPSFECWPTQKDYAMHEVLLGGWGCPIGELFDLEALAEQCKKLNRYSFFVTSEVCNVPGGVASPPNILGIF
ncbi:hypothetical protein P152DRAFT_458138 [Eremomyces bilateralis CBS 781.70]|uniref:Cyclase n=1 Tax=Eremomyces bilateralis CBS 781.70 TaxID=1392243 RepID=A0A6G1G4H4_9PEZI|nr:uncharacterized protein P152DRAFT_458138 [Eremomyces bilateralis CBS 781.70]KAF1812964.1 hypothetical protein P152DRAFT_458138 [Eremomyces bilateralis CBS 781.70]